MSTLVLIGAVPGGVLVTLPPWAKSLAARRRRNSPAYKTPVRNPLHRVKSPAQKNNYPYEVMTPMNRYETQLRALRAAFPYTIPIFAGFWFLGLTYGIYMNVSGFSFLYPMLMSLTIFAGSVEFITVNLLLGAFNPFQALFLTLMVNARHLFYGLSMLDKFRGLGWKKVYLIFGMCDESFSINYTAQIPPDVDRGWFMFFVTLLNHFYWFSGSTLGGIFGGLIQFNTEGLDFVMTAMFVVIFLEQWLKDKDHTSALVGLAASAVCLVLFGPDDFIIPAMLAILGGLTLLRGTLERKGALA